MRSSIRLDSIPEQHPSSGTTSTSGTDLNAAYAELLHDLLKVRLS